MYSVFVAILSFSESSIRDRVKCLFLNNKPCMVGPVLIDMNPVDLKCYPFMVSLNKCAGSCNTLSSKICVPKKRDINVKAFNMIANKNESKAMTERISCDCKCEFNSTTFNSNQKWNNKTCPCECKNYRKFKDDYIWIPSTCVCESSMYLKSAADTSVTECDMVVINNLSPKTINTTEKRQIL